MLDSLWRDSAKAVGRTSQFWIAMLLAMGLSGCGNDGSAAAAGGAVESNRAPLEVVEARMSAYNRHDLEAFLAQYADDVEIRSYPARSLGAGRDHLCDIFEPLFETGRVQVEIHHQATQDAFVVNHETVTEGSESTEYISIYEVRSGLIRSVCFVRD